MLLYFSVFDYKSQYFTSGRWNNTSWQCPITHGSMGSTLIPLISVSDRYQPIPWIEMSVSVSSASCIIGTTLKMSLMWLFLQAADCLDFQCSFGLSVFAKFQSTFMTKQYDIDRSLVAVNEWHYNTLVKMWSYVRFEPIKKHFGVLR